MPATDGLDRKRKVRAAHRGAVTRIMGQVRDNLDSPDGPNLRRLRQQKSTLSGKLDVLSKLDDELLDLVNEDDLEGEVEQADVIRERIGVCIMDIDDALDRDAQKSDPMRTTPMADPTGATGVVGTGISSATVSAMPTVSVAAAPIVSVAATPTVSVTATPTVSVTAAPTMSVTATPTVSLASGSSVAPGMLTPPTTDPSPATPHVKLPKLSIRKFGGDLTKWVTFWDCFDFAIHRNPSLSNVDKFNYLNSYLESTAAESVAGLTLTSANYEEAVSTLKRRFGNTQLIVDRHMDALLNLTSVTSHHDLRGLRRLYDSVEANVRGLRALGVALESYGGLLTSILMNKLPPEIRLIITEDRWDMEKVMKIISREVDARERSSTLSGSDPLPKKQFPKGPPTAAALVANDSAPHCVYCNQDHQSTSCTVVTDVDARREVLRKAGRCYVCLRRYHISRDCRSSATCSKCHGRHHVTICSRRSSGAGTATTSSDPTQDTQRTTNALYVEARTPILLQTAKLRLYNLNDVMFPPESVEVRAIMDSGSQRTYVTTHVKESLHLPSKRTESLRIKTFGSTEERETVCEAVELGLVTSSGERLKLSALAVPFICDPVTSQPISYSRECYDHLLGLELADSTDAEDVLEVDVLIGSDLYWSLVTGGVRRGRSGPTAIHTKVAWMGPVWTSWTTRDFSKPHTRSHSYSQD